MPRSIDSLMIALSRSRGVVILGLMFAALLCGGCGGHPPLKAYVWVMYPAPDLELKEVARLDAQGVQMIDGHELPGPTDTYFHQDYYELTPGQHTLVVKKGFRRGGMYRKTEEYRHGDAIEVVYAEAAEIHFHAEAGHAYALRYVEKKLPDERTGFEKFLKAPYSKGKYGAWVEDLGTGVITVREDLTIVRMYPVTRPWAD